MKTIPCLNLRTMTRREEVWQDEEEKKEPQVAGTTEGQKRKHFNRLYRCLSLISIIFSR